MANERITFEFDGKVAALIGLAVLLVLFVLLGVFAMIKGESGFPAAFLCFSLFSLLIFGLLVLSRSDIVLSEKGMARCLWGWTWKEIDWEGIERIVEFPASNGRGKYIRALNISPRAKPKLRFTPSGKMFFTLDMRDPAGLIDRLNHFIDNYHIDLVVRETPFGEPKKATRLAT
jgi:hypothetical protein